MRDSRTGASGGVCPRPAGVNTLKTASDGVSAGLSEPLGLEPEVDAISFIDSAGRELAATGVLLDSESTNGVN